MEKSPNPLLKSNQSTAPSPSANYTAPQLIPYFIKHSIQGGVNLMAESDASNGPVQS